MKHSILILACLVALKPELRSQTSTLQTKDLMLLHSAVADTIMDPDKFVLKVKVDAIASTKKLYFMIDTVMNSSAILNVIGTVVRPGADYKIQYSGQDYLFENYTATIPITLATPYKLKLFVTFYAEDNLGNTTSRIYLKF